MAEACSLYWFNGYEHRCDNALKVRFSATLGQEPEIELGSA